ncbi:hypothetical protein [Paenibacillus sinopodophylli]|uniref:hypothetical protein n=1 Tax=Paenibacillus sinopodophylli TaxID=1837342 RepID=UPI00110D19C0|nr:hypothetical protein [Paenibacillus sinopodophylli]
MNQYSQQPGNYQGQQGFLNQSTHYEPIGHVQSHYQGQLSQPSFGNQSNAIISNVPGGYQASNSYNQGIQHYAPNNYLNSTNPVGTNHSFISHQPVQSYAQSPATAFGNVGPVIAHVGYQAGNDNQHSYYQPSSNAGSHYVQHTASNYGGYAQANHQNGYGGMTPTHSSTPLNPVYEATNAYQQAGPVISHVGWQAQSAANSPYSGGMR